MKCSVIQGMWSSDWILHTLHLQPTLPCLSVTSLGSRNARKHVQVERKLWHFIWGCGTYLRKAAVSHLSPKSSQPSERVMSKSFAEGVRTQCQSTIGRERGRDRAWEAHYWRVVWPCWTPSVFQIMDHPLRLASNLFINFFCSMESDFEGTRLFTKSRSSTDQDQDLSLIYAEY